MAEFRTGTPEQRKLLDDLVGAGHLVPSGIPGVFGRGAVFEDVRMRFDAFVTQAAAGDRAEPLRFPSLLPRHQLESTGYLKSFPHLAGTVFSFEGSAADALTLQERAANHEDWSEFQTMTDLVLVPAACYPVYPAIAARGPLAPGGTTVDTGGAPVFRHEPSDDPSRLQAFHMRELVRIGEPETVAAWRDAWRDRSVTLLASLGLDAQLEVAADPFFGRGGRMLAANQREQQLKFEVLVPVAGVASAVASFNYHQEHFAATYGLRLADGGVAHTACLGFGHERIVIALLAVHGLDVARWPAQVRDALWAGDR